MHLVILDGLLVDRAEGAQADMQRNLGNVNAHRTDGVHQLRGEVQTGRGGGGAAQLLGVNGLVLALVLQLFGDVGRQRHLAELVQLLIQRFGVIGKGNIFVAVWQSLIHHSRQAAVAELHLSACLHPLAGAGQALPGVPFHLAQQQ